jgi:hypothetical protein
VHLAGLLAPLAIDKMPLPALPLRESRSGALCSSIADVPPSRRGSRSSRDACCVIRLDEARDDNSLAENNKKALRPTVNKQSARPLTTPRTELESSPARAA